MTRKHLRAFDLLRGEAERIRKTPFGNVGELYSGHEIEAVWVSKHGEEIDPGWFSPETVDLLLVVQGALRVEFADKELSELTLDAGQLLILPRQTRCRAYRWPREAIEATIFLAVYPKNTETARGRSPAS